MLYRQEVIYLLGVLDSAGSNRGQVKDTGIQVERLLEELMGRSPAETRRRDSEDAREEPEWSREEVAGYSIGLLRWVLGGEGYESYVL